MPRLLRKYAYNIIILGFLGFALWQAFEPFLFHGEEVQNMRRDMRALSPAKLEEMLQNPAKKPSILFIYASWCSPCHETGQMLLRLSKAGDLSSLYTVFLSLDTVEADLARFFVMQGYHTQFSPYMLDRNAPGISLEDMLNLDGSSFGTAIPYLAVFDGEGKLVREVMGPVDEPTLRRMIAAIDKKPALPAY